MQQAVNSVPDAALKNLRKQITLLSTMISGVILLVIVVSALLLTEAQLNNSSKHYLQGSLNSVIARLQSDSVVSHTWMAQTEISGQMILYLMDGNSMLHFPGAWTPQTDRSKLLERAQQEAEKQGLRLNRRPLSLVNIPTVFFTIDGDHGDSYLGSAAIIPSDNGWQSIILLRDRSGDQQTLWFFRGAFAALSIIGIIFLLWLCWLVSGRTIRPIAENRKKQVEFIAAASHELRSPLAVIQASSSALGDSSDSDAALRSTIQRECIRMSRLVNDLLTLARSDAGTWSIQNTTVDLDILLLEITDKFFPITAQKKQTLILEVPDDTLPPINGDFQRLDQLLTILLDNACSYTPIGGHITLSASFNKHKVLLKVSDNGPGISPEHQEHIFDRFYRADTSRTQKEHCGLGLAIAQELAFLHSGRLYLDTAVSSGATFVLELPRKNNKKFLLHKDG